MFFYTVCNLFLVSLVTTNLLVISHVLKRAIMDFNGNLLTRCGKTYLRAFLSWIAGMALSMK